MQGGAAPIPVYRPSYLTDGLEFQALLLRAQRTCSISASVQVARALVIREAGGSSSSFRQPAHEPRSVLEIPVEDQKPLIWNQVLQYIAVRGVRGPKADRTEEQSYAGDVGAANSGSIGPPAICFADGDAFTSC